MLNYFQHILLLIKRLLILVVLFQVGRLYFFIVNHNFYSHLSASEVFGAFFYGTRFDITAIIYFNLVFIIMHFIPGNFKNNRAYQLILKILFISVNSLLVLANLADAEYFQFTDKRTTADFFSLTGLGNDFISLLPRYIIDYWYLLLICLILMTASWFIYPVINNETVSEIRNRQLTVQIVISLVLMGLFIAAARGVGLKPTRIITAAEYTSTENIPLVLNTPFTVITTVQKADINNQKYFTEDKLDSLYTPVKIFPHTELRKFNVVIIILESFSKDYIGYYNKKHKYTPFLDSLIRQSLSFDNSFACGKRSIEAIPAILAGIPSLMDNPYITSQYCIDRINSIASLLGPEGYHTSFFHGGTNGTMGFDYFVNIAGIKHYYGKNEYPNPGDFDGNWGIYDEPFFRYFAEQLDNFPQPFFSCLFSLSSHHPYSIPSEYLGKFKGGKLKILKSIEYTDYSLRRFFQTASKKDWFPNTLFVITADHTSQPMTQYYNNKIGAYSVPILFYKPDDIRLRGLSSTIVQHTDIMPSVLDYLGYNKEFICYGNSLFDNTHTHFSVNFNNSVYQIIEGNRVLFFDGDRITGLYRFNTDSFLLKNLIKKERADRQVEKLKAIIQSFGDRLVSNRLTKEGS